MDSQINTNSAQRVFHYFKEISAIPRGSGNMKAIADYCVDFAVKNGLKYVRDEADNVVIYKNPTSGYECAEPVILQGHLDMVCQKEEGKSIDFLEDGIEIIVDGDFIKADGTTLGADNGIAVAIILAILESSDIAHPPIEAVFTTDEEIGMVGAFKLDMSLLSGKKMINLDAEEDGTVTVSCAGGSDLTADFPFETVKKHGTKISISLKGLKGGHSGVEINSGRVNADILAGRFLNHLKNKVDFDIISINGGDKPNAIPNTCTIELCTEDAGELINLSEEYLQIIKKEISEREKDFEPVISSFEADEFSVFPEEIKEKLIFTLLCVPNGVMEMSAHIENLVETSLNLGILKTEKDKILLHFALRSNIKSALVALEEKLMAFFASINMNTDTFGHYPPWEYKEDSELQKLYTDVYRGLFSNEPKIEAIHAGLECGVFASFIEDFDCIAIGPALYDVHTVNEKLSISSTENLYSLLKNLLEKCN